MLLPLLVLSNDILVTRHLNRAIHCHVFRRWFWLPKLTGLISWTRALYQETKKLNEIDSWSNEAYRTRTKNNKQSQWKFFAGMLGVWRTITLKSYPRIIAKFISWQFCNTVWNAFAWKSSLENLLWSNGSCAGFTGADLQNLMNEAAILAARRNLIGGV